MKTLTEAAQAVLDRWDSPQWAWTKHGPTADMMHDLRAALTAQAQAEPYAWAVSGLGRPFYGEFAEQDARAEARRCGGTSEAFPLYRHSAQPKRQPLTARMACACGDEYDPGTAGGKEIFITGRCPGCNAEKEAAAPQPAQPERKRLKLERIADLFGLGHSLLIAPAEPEQCHRQSSPANSDNKQ